MLSKIFVDLINNLRALSLGSCHYLRMQIFFLIELFILLIH